MATIDDVRNAVREARHPAPNYQKPQETKVALIAFQSTLTDVIDQTFSKDIRIFSGTTATITVAESDSGKVYIGKRSSSTQIFTLPSASTAGLTYTFICGDVGGMVQIKGQSGDTINCKSNADGTDRVSVSVAADTGIRNNAATNVLGDNITLVSDGITTWWMTAQSGIFSSL
jgi:hypothetical protein